MNKENSPESIEKYNRVLFNVNNFMVEQTETGDYNKLVSLVVDQLDKLLRPIVTTYSEYDEQNKTLRIKEIKANQGVLDIFLKVSGKKLSSLATSVDAQLYSVMKADRVKIFPNLHEASGRAIPKTVSGAVSKAIGINCYLGLSYVVDDQVFGTTVIALREKPDQFMMEPLKAYAYFTSLSLKRIFADQALKQSKQELKTISDNIVDLVAMTDVEGKFTFLSGNYLELLGYEKEELLGKSVFEIVYTEDLEKTAELFSKHISTGEDGRAEYRAVRKDGNLIWVETVGRIIFDNSQVSGALFVTRDITDRKRIESKLSFIKDVVMSSSSAIATCDLEGYITYGNPFFQKLWGFVNQEDFLGKPIRNLWMLGYREEYIMRTIQSEGTWEGELKGIKKDGSLFDILVSAAIVLDNLGNPIAMTSTSIDITDRKKAEEKIRYMSLHDQLTDLHNRYYFESCEEELKDIPVLSVIMTDVNGLKLINDTYGHQVGDEMLKKYAELLKKSFKQSDLIFRWGGDEFIIILKNTEEAKSWELCNRLVKHCGETYVKDIPLSISVGISSKLQGGDINVAIKEAEDMMYKHKLTESNSSKNLIMKTLQQALSGKSFESKEHIDRMTHIGRQFGEKLSLSPSELSRLETLTMLHDIGKINIDSHILLKETALTDEEWEEIKKHPEVGYRITRTAEEFAYVAEDILAHHERWDGKGYPQGLQGEGIPYLARLLNIIDNYDVMSNGRPYKKKMSLAEIIDEIERCSGKQFDPDLAKEFVAFLKEETITYQQ